MKTTVVLSTLLSSLLVTALIAQTQSPTTLRPLRDEVPQAALLTQRGAELAERLKWLRHSEASMGKNHPLLPEVRLQIKGIQDQLKAWAPAPEDGTYEGFDLKRAIPKMNDEDLRQMVISLADQVADLKKRVETLERRR